MCVQERVFDQEVVVRNRFSTVLMVALVVVLALSMTACGKKSDKSADLKLGEGKTSASTPQGTSATNSDTSGTGASGTKATDPAAQEPASGANSSGNTGGSTASGNTGGTTGGTSGGTSASAKGLTIKILWWNDTAERAPKNAEVVFGNRIYRPRTGKSDQGSIGPCPVGKPLKLIVYPDGRNGAKLEAEFTVDAQMVANSDQDAIHVEVKDTRVRVLGNPVNNFMQSFARP